MKSSEAKSARDGTGHRKGSLNQAEALHELFVMELQDIYWAEKALTNTIPKIIKNVTKNRLETVLTDHLGTTKQHVHRLEEVFTSISEKAVAKKCKAMVGLIDECEQIIENTERGIIRDEGIISACQKIEHYEIASYGTLCAFAKKTG